MYSLHDPRQDPEAFTWDILCLYYLAHIGDKEAIKQTDIINKILFEELDIEGWVVHGNREKELCQ